MSNNVVLEVPKEIYDALVKASKLSGKPIEELIIDAIRNQLDPKEKAKLYIELHNKYLREAEEFYVKGDLVQAGEKYWGAVTALLNAIGELRGWDHYSHVDYNMIIQRLYEETGDKELMTGFAMAERLHANFYHNFMNKGSFELHKDHVLNLIRRLKEILTKTA